MVSAANPERTRLVWAIAVDSLADTVLLHEAAAGSWLLLYVCGKHYKSNTDHTLSCAIQLRWSTAHSGRLVKEVKPIQNGLVLSLCSWQLIKESSTWCFMPVCVQLRLQVENRLVLLVLQVEESKPYVKQYGEERLPRYLQVIFTKIPLGVLHRIAMADTMH